MATDHDPAKGMPRPETLPELSVPRPDEFVPADEMTMLRGWLVHLRQSAIFKLEDRCSVCGQTPRLKVVPFRGRPWGHPGAPPAVPVVGCHSEDTSLTSSAIGAPTIRSSSSSNVL